MHNPDSGDQEISDAVLEITAWTKENITHIVYGEACYQSIPRKNDDAYVAENKWHKNLLRIVAVLVISLIVSAGITIAFAVGKYTSTCLIFVAEIRCAFVGVRSDCHCYIGRIADTNTGTHRKCRETVSGKRMEPVYSMAITEIHDAMRPLLKVLPKSCRTSSFLIAVGKYVHFMPTAGEAMLKADMGHSFSAIPSMKPCRWILMSMLWKAISGK